MKLVARADAIHLNEILQTRRELVRGSMGIRPLRQSLFHSEGSRV